jgi:ComF family protein
MPLQKDTSFCPDCVSRLKTHEIYGPVLENAETVQEYYHLCSFTPDVRQVIHHLKYKAYTKAAVSLMEELLSRADADFFTSCESIIPVPLHPFRTLKRGYNQAAVISAVISRHYDIPVVSCIIRRKYTRTQTKKNRAQRTKNVAGVFRENPKHPLRKGSRVLIVDDVMTTGATVKSCAEAAKNAGAGDIRVFTLARA